MRSTSTHAATTAAVALVLLAWAPAVFAENVETDFEVSPGQELTLDLRGVGGELEIEGWEQNRVHIEGRVRMRGWGRRDDEGLLDIEQTRAGIEVYADADHGDDVDARLKVRVPSEFDVRVRGALETTISNVKGNVELMLGNADADLTNVHGNCRISTANGRLRIDGCTLNGDINNTNGRLTIDNSDVSGDVVSTNSNMDVSRAPEGLEATSTNGNIKIDSVKDHFRGKTTNGNVTIRELDGWIDTETVNGNVKVRLVGNPDGKRSIDIETLNGSVDVAIPENFSMSFDIEVRDEDRRRRRGSRYEIVSDFDLEIENDESRRGDRYRIYGTGSLGDGRNSVRIRATNGDVYLRKAR